MMLVSFYVFWRFSKSDTLPNRWWSYGYRINMKNRIGVKDKIINFKINSIKISNRGIMVNINIIIKIS